MVVLIGMNKESDFSEFSLKFFSFFSMQSLLNHILWEYQKPINSSCLILRTDRNVILVSEIFLCVLKSLLTDFLANLRKSLAKIFSLIWLLILILWLVLLITVVISVLHFSKVYFLTSLLKKLFLFQRVFPLTLHLFL